LTMSTRRCWSSGLFWLWVCGRVGEGKGEGVRGGRERRLVLLLSPPVAHGLSAEAFVCPRRWAHRTGQLLHHAPRPVGRSRLGWAAFGLARVFRSVEANRPERERPTCTRTRPPSSSCRTDPSRGGGGGRARAAIPPLPVGSDRGRGARERGLGRGHRLLLNLQEGVFRPCAGVAVCVRGGVDMARVSCKRGGEQGARVRDCERREEEGWGR
jgi:hypothetical protein